MSVPPQASRGTCTPLQTRARQQRGEQRLRQAPAHCSQYGDCRQREEECLHVLYECDVGKGQPDCGVVPRSCVPAQRRLPSAPALPELRLTGSVGGLGYSRVRHVHLVSHPVSWACLVWSFSGASSPKPGPCPSRNAGFCSGTCWGRWGPGTPP